MLLYHPSDKKFKIVKVEKFGEHYYTTAEKKTSSVKRSFWYFKLPIPEKGFEYSPYIYVTKINKSLLYNLTTDKKKLGDKFNNIHELLLYLKKHYIGAYYKPDGYNIVCIFYDIKPIKIMKINK